MRVPIIFAMLLTSAAVSPAMAQEPGSRHTREFVQAAAQSDTFETMEATTAIAESTNPQVLAFANEMLKDHAETSRALSQAVATAALTQPVMAVGAAQSPFLGALQGLRGPQFDQAYWRQQALAHRSALVVEQQYAANGDTPALRNAATAAIPVIQSHLAMAEKMNAQAKAGM